MRSRTSINRPKKLLVLTFALAAGVALSACGSSPSRNGAATTNTSSPGTTTTTAQAPTAAQQAAVSDGATLADTDSTGVEWLCRPDQSSDPCTSSLTTTVIPASGATTLENFSDASSPKIDCFYVYPTVSPEPSIVANLDIQDAEISVAKAQASEFSRVCRVYAPIYPQLTLHAISDTGGITVADTLKAYDGVLAAWNDYLQNYNDGRGVIVIGHSQGAALLIDLLRQKVDEDPAVRKLLVSAIILGGNVTVPIGKGVGGSFQNIPACRSETQIECVIAYSSFDQQPPADSLFGRPGQGVSSLGRQLPLPASELQVLCVNPAALAGGSATLDPLFPTASVAAGLGAEASGAPRAATPWVSEPDLYSGECMYQDGASWLQVSAPINAGDTRGVVHQILGPTWGLHLVDVNIALGNMIDVVTAQANAYVSGVGSS